MILLKLKKARQRHIKYLYLFVCGYAEMKQALFQFFFIKVVKIMKSE